MPFPLYDPFFLSVPGHDETAVQNRVNTAPKKKQIAVTSEKNQLQYSVKKCNNNGNSYSMSFPVSGLTNLPVSQ